MKKRALSMKKKERIYFYDNLKYILTTLVVIGHLLLLVPDLFLSKGFILFIYSFHMPLFIFVTGYFSKKSKSKNSKFPIGRVINFLLFYIIFKVCAMILVKGIYHQYIPLTLIAEQDAPWYLLATVIWIILTYVLDAIKPKYLLSASIVVALLAGFDIQISDVLCISRVIVFYPFYLLGYYMTQEKMNAIVNKLHTRKWQIISFIGIVALLITFIVFENQLYFMKPIFTGQNPYATLTYPWNHIVMGLICRTLMYVLSFVVSLGVISLTPRRKMKVTLFGSRTLQVYTLHYFIYYIAKFSGFNDMIINVFGNYGALIYIIIGTGLTVLLSFKIFEYPFTKLMGIKYDKILKK